jgi:hypothetical protein
MKIKNEAVAYPCQRLLNILTFKLWVARASLQLMRNNQNMFEPFNSKTSV